jgi:hypothetical protein
MFLGIKPSFLPEFQDEAERFIVEINRALRGVGSSAYVDPDVLPHPYIKGWFGRSSLDHQGAGTIEALAEYCCDARSPNLDVLTANPYRMTFLPRVLSGPVETDYAERISGELTKIWVGFLPALAVELRSVAREMEIPLEDGALSDEVARRINDYEPFSEGDPCDPDHRMAWLMLYEECRLAMSYQVALSFAG